MKYLETPLVNLSISLNSLGEISADISSISEEKLKKTLDAWNPEYQNTQKLLYVLREGTRFYHELIRTLERHLQAT